MEKPRRGARRRGRLIHKSIVSKTKRTSFRMSVCFGGDTRI